MLTKNLTNVSTANIELFNSYKTFKFSDVTFSLLLKKDSQILKFKNADKQVYLPLNDFFFPSSTAIFYFDHYDDILKGRSNSNCLNVHEQIFQKYVSDLFCIEIFCECIDQYSLKIRYVI